ncbi:MAG: hypothetical protein EBR06_06420 [Acidimicrobiia bacterium]|nr:hypothetical protein [Acidimicrobiia bacterium]
MPRFGQVITAMVTPFHKDGSLNLDGARRLARWLQDNGNDGLVLAGTTGEAPVLTDDERLSVVLGDAAEVASHPHWRGQIDALQVDLYDHEAAAPVLDDEAFYRGCRELLTDDGLMTVNLFGRDASFDASVARMRAAFGSDALWAFGPTREGNTIVLAQREAAAPPRATLLERAAAIESRWRLPARKWLRSFRRLE